MGSSGKKRTTAAKLNREGKLRERRVEKQARKAARRLSAERDGVTAFHPAEPGDRSAGRDGGDSPDSGDPDAKWVAAAPDVAGLGA